LTVKVFDPAQRAEQPPHRMEGDVAGMGFAEGPHHLDPAAGSYRCGLAGHPALADARRSHYVHDTTAGTDHAVHHGVEGGHLPAPPDQARLGASHEAIPRVNRQQPVHAHRLVDSLDVHPLRFSQHHGVLD
jgi:hypothetical protein